MARIPTKSVAINGFQSGNNHPSQPSSSVRTSSRVNRRGRHPLPSTPMAVIQQNQIQQTPLFSCVYGKCQDMDWISVPEDGSYPPWTYKYSPGMLPVLGLRKGVVPRCSQHPGREFNLNVHRNMGTWKYFYVILQHTPGGCMSGPVLRETLKEWMPELKLCKGQSYRACLTHAKKWIKCFHDPHTKKDMWKLVPIIPTRSVEGPNNVVAEAAIASSTPATVENGPELGNVVPRAEVAYPRALMEHHPAHCGCPRQAAQHECRHNLPPIISRVQRLMSVSSLLNMPALEMVAQEALAIHQNNPSQQTQHMGPPASLLKRKASLQEDDAGSLRKKMVIRVLRWE